MKEKKTIFRICTVAVFAALCFVSNYFSIPIPVAIGDVTRIHLGNIFCLLSGFLLGPLGGGLAAGIGASLYDLTNPAYVMSAPFTLVFKFVLAFVCGWIAHLHGRKARNIPMNITAAIVASLCYITLYLGKSAVEGLLLGNALGALLPALVAKLITSATNACIAVVASIPLCAVLRTALDKSKLLDAFQKE